MTLSYGVARADVHGQPAPRLPAPLLDLERPTANVRPAGVSALRQRMDALSLQGQRLSAFGLE